MLLKNSRFLIAVCLWGVCVIGVLASVARVIWTIEALVWIAALAGCGICVVVTIASLSRRRGKIGGATIGFFCGLIPSALIFTWIFVVRPGFEASAGLAGFAYLLVVPSGVGGTIAGIICSETKETTAAL